MSSVISSTMSNAREPRARMLIQQCSYARLQVAPQTKPSQAEFVQINEGVVIYVSFLKGATRETTKQMAKDAMTVRLSGTYGCRMSVLDLPGDVLIFPQSTLGGKIKGRRASYSRNADKDTSQQLYLDFIDRCRELMFSQEQTRGKTLHSGSFDNKQEAFCLQTNSGPFAHIFDY